MVPVKAFLKLIVLYVWPSRKSVKVPVDWAFPACVKNKVASRVKMYCFIIFGSVCINVLLKLRVLAMFLRIVFNEGHGKRRTKEQ